MRRQKYRDLVEAARYRHLRRVRTVVQGYHRLLERLILQPRGVQHVEDYVQVHEVLQRRYFEECQRRIIKQAGM